MTSTWKPTRDPIHVTGHAKERYASRVLPGSSINEESISEWITQAIRETTGWDASRTGGANRIVRITKDGMVYVVAVNGGTISVVTCFRKNQFSGGSKSKSNKRGRRKGVEEWREEARRFMM